MSIRYHALLLALYLVLPLPASAQWEKAPDFPNDFFNEVYFIDNLTGWVTRMSGSVSRTIDGGNTWQSSTLPGSAFSSNRDIRFISSTGGFVSGEDGIWKTTDGGSTWTNITPTGFPNGSTGSWFTDMSTGVIGVGNCLDSTATFYSTTDGGATWSSVQHTSTADVAIGGITFNSGTWYVVGGRGKLWRSNDGGATWTLSNTGSNGWQEDIIAWGGDLLVASTNGSSCGASTGGTILRSTNGGSNWTISSFPRNLMWGVTRFSSTDGWACGDGGLAVRTTDGGNTWIDQSCGLPRTIRVDDICVTDATHGWAVGDGLYRIASQTIEVDPDTIDFGDIRVGATSADSNALVRSYFTTATTASLRLGGADPGQFAIAGGTVSIPVGVCSSSPAPVRFAPTSGGVKIALLEVTIPSTTVRRFVVLKGRGVEPDISVSAKPRLDTIVCGSTVLDSFLVRNVGTAPLTLTGANYRDGAGGTLRLAGPALPQTIAPGGELWLKVRATATIPGPFSSEIDLYSDDLHLGHSPVLVRMRFYRRAISATYTTTVLTLNSTRVGDRSASGCIEYRNTGDGPQVIEGIDPESGDPAITPVGASFPITVPAGGTARLCFEGVPADTGFVTRRFRVRTEPCALDTSITVRLYGRAAFVRADTLLALAPITCEPAARATATVFNDGNDTLRLGRPEITGPDAGGVTIVAPTSWPLRIAPGTSAQILVDLAPSSAMPSATLRFATNDPRPLRDTIAIRITTTRTVAVAQPTQRRIDVGMICMGAARSVPLYIEGTGSAPAHVTTARLLEGSDAGVSILMPPTGGDLVRGALDSLLLAIVPRTSGAFRALVEIHSEPCGRLDTVEVVGTGAAVELASDGGVALGTIMRGRATTARITVRNDGNVPATITAISIGSPARVTITSPQLPATIAAAGSIDLELAIASDIAGTIAENLVITSTNDCVDTLRIGVSGIVVEPGGISLLLHTREVRFGDLFRCEDSCGVVSLESVGTGPVSVLDATLEGDATGVSIGDFPRTPIAPGDSMSIPICFDPVSDGHVLDATLVLTTTDSLAPQMRIPLRGAAMAGLATASELSFGVVADGVARDTTLAIANSSKRPLTITRAVVAAPFTVETQLPQTIAPGGTLELRLRARDIENYAEGSLVLLTSHPCGDSLLVALEAFSDDRFSVSAGADTSVGRWGEQVMIPISYTDTTRASVDSLELVVTAAPTLLDPVGAIAAPGLLVERLGFDAANGALRLSVRSADGSAIAPSAELVRITYEVLRGDRIATSVTPVVVGLRRGIASETIPGAFLLADYCDAHARLLTVTGTIALEQNAPNPASTMTSIEFETSFDGLVAITLHDALGDEVLRLVDEWMPAGRRRVDVRLEGLAAGAYTYRMSTGRQTRVRTMVVVP